MFYLKVANSCVNCWLFYCYLIQYIVYYKYKILGDMREGRLVVGEISIYTIYDCKRNVEQTSIAQLVKLNETQVVIKHTRGMFTTCDIKEVMPVFRFKTIERRSSMDEEDLASIEAQEGVYRVVMSNLIIIYLIIFRDLSAVVHVPNNNVVVFWNKASEMLRHIATSSLLWIP